MQELIKKYAIRCLLLVPLIGPGTACADSLNIAVASNFIAAMQEIQTAFEASSEHELQLIRGSSGKHYAQIINGAPFDVFLSADQERPQRLVEEGVADPASLRTYAEGQLALWSREEGLDLGPEYLLNTINYSVIAIANPRLAPYGKAAIEVLGNLGIEEVVGDSLVMGENIAQAFQFAYSGNADLGLVAYSQTLSANLQAAGSVWLVPNELHEPIKQDMVILKESPAAVEFAAFMEGSIVQDILVRSGYLLPRRTH